MALPERSAQHQLILIPPYYIYMRDEVPSIQVQLSGPCLFLVC